MLRWFESNSAQLSDLNKNKCHKFSDQIKLIQFVFFKDLSYLPEFYTEPQQKVKVQLEK